jgi:hypothetical protein
MHEDILGAIGRRNETEALGVVEPLYYSCNHENTSVWLNCDSLQFIPESVCGSNCRRNWEGLPNCLQEVRCNPGTMTGAGVNSYNYVASLPKAALAFKSHWRVALLSYRPAGRSVVAGVRRG